MRLTIGIAAVPKLHVPRALKVVVAALLHESKRLVDSATNLEDLKSRVFPIIHALSVVGGDPFRYESQDASTILSVWPSLLKWSQLAAKLLRDEDLELGDRRCLVHHINSTLTALLRCGADGVQLMTNVEFASLTISVWMQPLSCAIEQHDATRLFCRMYEAHKPAVGCGGSAWIVQLRKKIEGVAEREKVTPERLIGMALRRLLRATEKTFRSRPPSEDFRPNCHLFPLIVLSTMPDESPQSDSYTLTLERKGCVSLIAKILVDLLSGAYPQAHSQEFIKDILVSLVVGLQSATTLQTIINILPAKLVESISRMSNKDAQTDPTTTATYVLDLVVGQTLPKLALFHSIVKQYSRAFDDKVLRNSLQRGESASIWSRLIDATDGMHGIYSHYELEEISGNIWCGNVSRNSLHSKKF